MKRGFGLLEVIVAAIVLAFMLIGLNTLQKGNRESILRVRARDVANVVAQDIIDSLSALGPASVRAGIYEDILREHIFTGSVSRLLKDTMQVKVPYMVKLDIREEAWQTVSNTTQFQGVLATLDLTHQIAKQVDVTVNWKFKNSDQSIMVSALIK